MRHDQIKNRKSDEFQRLVGVQPAVFEELLEAVQKHTRLFGRPGKLSLPDQLLLCLMCWREYRTMAQIAITYEVSEPTVHRTIRKIEAALVASGNFLLPGKKALHGADLAWEVVIVDATEVPIQRPQKDNGAPTTALLQRQEEAPHPQSATPRPGEQPALDLHRLFLGQNS